MKLTVITQHTIEPATPTLCGRCLFAGGDFEETCTLFNEHRARSESEDVNDYMRLPACIEQAKPDLIHELVGMLEKDKEPAPLTLYDECVKLGYQLDHWESDLYIKYVRGANQDELIKRHGFRGKLFTSQIDHESWIDVPFAYQPFWVKKEEEREAAGVIASDAVEQKNRRRGR